MSAGRRLLLTVAIPIALVGSIFYGPLIPGSLDGVFDDLVFPFAITYWFGLNFSNMYFYLQEDLQRQGAGKGTIALVAGGLALVFFVAAGGPKLIWRDTWMFGAAVMPGIDIAGPAAREWMERQQAKKAPVPASIHSEVSLDAPSLSAEATSPPDAG